MRAEIVRYGQSVNVFRKIRANLKKVPDQMTLEMARVLKERVKANLVSNSYTTGKHSTPQSLSSFVYMDAGTKGHYVQVGPTPYDKSFPGRGFAKAVEEGTDSHTIGEGPGGPAFGIPGMVVTHPGAKAKRYMAKAIKTFKSTDRDKILARNMDKILR